MAAASGVARRGSKVGPRTMFFLLWGRAKFSLFVVVDVVYGGGDGDGG